MMEDLSMSMFKKNEPETHFNEFPQAAARPIEPTQPRVQATIGSTIRIKGDVSGDENLTIDGTVDGTVSVKQHSLQIGKNGRVNADLHAKSIQVEGHVEGNLHAEEKVVIRQSGIVRGNIVSPRLTMEDGCTFKGSVDMDNRAAAGKMAADAAARARPASMNGGDGEHVLGGEKKSEQTSARAG
jgi:cytoskeletal protein CcmA (bactofilin family)